MGNEGVGGGVVNLWRLRRETERRPALRIPSKLWKNVSRTFLLAGRKNKIVLRARIDFVKQQETLNKLHARMSHKGCYVNFMRII